MVLLLIQSLSWSEAKEVNLLLGVPDQNFLEQIVKNSVLKEKSLCLQMTIVCLMCLSVEAHNWRNKLRKVLLFSEEILKLCSSQHQHKPSRQNQFLEVEEDYLAPLVPVQLLLQEDCSAQ